MQAVLLELSQRKIAKITLANLPADSNTSAALSSSASPHGYHMHLRVAYLCARVVLGSVEERAVVKQTVGSKKRLRRNMRELAKRGPVRILHETSWEQIEPVLPSFTRAHVARFLEKGQISNLIRDERRAFLTVLAQELSAGGWIAMSRLLVGDVTAAWNYGFRFGGSWFWYQPTVSNRYGDFSPGYCLLAKIIELSCDSPDFDIVDLGLGAEDYKDRFATATRQTLYCEMSASVSRHLQTEVRNRVAAAAQVSPRVESAIRSMIAQAGGLRKHLRESGLWNLSSWMVRRTWSSLFAFDRVLFFEWPAGGQNTERSGHSLHELNSDLIGAAGILYADDLAALGYLMRSAQRLESGKGQGFALSADDGTPVHFCWVTDFEGFEMAELDCTLHSPAKDALMIFDCFTPSSCRGRHFFAKAISALADQLHSQVKAVWIFGLRRTKRHCEGLRKLHLRTNSP